MKRITDIRNLTPGVLILLSTVPFSANAANGITSVNQYVEINTSATDFRARAETNAGQRSNSGYDFVITPEKVNICEGGGTGCDTAYSANFNVPSGSASSITFGKNFISKA